MSNDIGAENNTIAACIFDSDGSAQTRNLDLEFEGFNPIGLDLKSNGERSFCGFHYVPDNALPDSYAELE